jgi:hypothetical protein
MFSHQIIINGVIGSASLGDIALDDITLTDGACVVPAGMRLCYTLVYTLAAGFNQINYISFFFVFGPR